MIGETHQDVVVEKLLDAVGLAAAVEESGDDHCELKVVELVDANLRLLLQGILKGKVSLYR
jgi:hypothetical protein